MQNNSNFSNLECISDVKSLLGEGPIWDADSNKVYWVDILQGMIHELSTKDRSIRSISTQEMIGAVSLCTNGQLLAALKSGLAYINSNSGAKEHLTHAEAELPNNRYNDGKCDPAGRFWIGTMSLNEEPGAGNLYQFTTDIGIQKKLSNVTISNGLAWSLDNKTFYYIDTPCFEVWAYDYDINTGNIENKKVVIQIPPSEGYPDGMSIDEEGMLWIAHWDGWQVARWNPNTGEKLLSVQIPAARVTSCCFGGPNLNDLYITTAKVGLSKEDEALQPLAGSLFYIRNLPFKGVPVAPFKCISHKKP